MGWLEGCRFTGKFLWGVGRLHAVRRWFGHCNAIRRHCGDMDLTRLVAPLPQELGMSRRVLGQWGVEGCGVSQPFEGVARARKRDVQALEHPLPPNRCVQGRRGLVGCVLYARPRPL